MRPDRAPVKPQRRRKMMMMKLQATAAMTSVSFVMMVMIVMMVKVIMWDTIILGGRWWGRRYRCNTNCDYDGWNYITVMEVMMNVMTESWLPVLSILLIGDPSVFYSRLSRAGSQWGRGLFPTRIRWETGGLSHAFSIVTRSHQHCCQFTWTACFWTAERESEPLRLALC